MIERLIALLALSLIVGIPFGIVFALTSHILLYFIFMYPLFMSGLWMGGGLIFWFQHERGASYKPDPPPQLEGMPLVSILIPCFNEELNVEQTLLAALAQQYPHIEVIAINDGSSDNTAKLLDQLSQEHEKLRVIHLATNQGKAMALRMGAVTANGDYLVCIDGDALLDPEGVNYLVAPMLAHPEVGAVTGNPRIRTRSTLIGRIQVGEFSSIIGLIKRTQRVYGKVFTISGVIASFRRQALEEVDYWSLDMITEDIDVTWKLQLADWEVFYEPRALCWVLMPETLKGLFKQRLRWAQGGAETFLKYIAQVVRWENRSLWPLIVEYLLSTLWSFALGVAVLVWLTGQLLPLPAAMQIEGLFPPSFTGMVLAGMCLLQFTVSTLIDRRYETDLHRSMFWIIWYPFAYWLINFSTTLWSFPVVMLRLRRQRARWSSPDRGIKELS
ncbi:MAG TPA: poly-beta-1,6 N-acetyl-D-glucosamine synthase [Alcaligenaceae bacterium]|nr:poly-beta-1,6 N-acetyl-D-glucosamine synthase [Alcaligenaceae bacterium]